MSQTRKAARPQPHFVVIIRFPLIATGTADSTTLSRKSGDRWKAVFHQGTIMLENGPISRLHTGYDGRS
jgi:hypothetical protein